MPIPFLGIALTRTFCGKYFTVAHPLLSIFTPTAGRKPRKVLRWIVLAAGAILAWWGWVPAEAPSDCHLSANGAWLSVDWTSQPVDAGHIEQLAEDASRRRLRYLYPFVSYLKADGTFSDSYDEASKFTAAFRQFNRETRLLAWVGIPLVKEGRLGIEGTVDLSDAAVREKIVAFAVRMVDEAGFDGVHLDVETVYSGNEDYLLLLEEVKAAIGDRMLSVAGSYVLPAAVNEMPVLQGFKWDEAYYQAVAERVDQIVVMGYDSGMPTPALYRLWMREQVLNLERSLEAAEVEVLIGLSVSEERTLTHHPHAENMRNGLAGVCAGHRHRDGTDARVKGIAIYASWEAGQENWSTWEQWISNADE